MIFGNASGFIGENIKMINIIKYFFVGICFIANVFSAEIQTILSAEDSFAGWKVAYRLK